MNKKKIIIVSVMVAVCMGLGTVVWKMMSSGKIEPGIIRSSRIGTPEPGVTARVSVTNITDWYEAVGTVRPRTELRISARVTALVTEIRFSPGAAVKKGQMLITLDDRQLLSRLDQARQSLKSARAGEEQAAQAVIAGEAAFKQAESAYKRIQTYYESQASTLQDVEHAESAYRQANARLKQTHQALTGAKAQIRQAEEVVNEATIAISYTQIKAPEDGEVLERFVEPGDMALPGKPLLVMRTSGSLRLEAFVREGLIPNVGIGKILPVAVNTLKETVDARVEEIIPYADPRSRTFLVKSALPEIAGLYPGMFGKLLVPVQEHRAVVIPREAVRRVGQLELVLVREGEVWTSVFVKTGRAIKEQVEVLSGLVGDETIGWEK